MKDLTEVIAHQLVTHPDAAWRFGPPLLPR